MTTLSSIFLIYNYKNMINTRSNPSNTYLIFRNFTTYSLYKVPSHDELACARNYKLLFAVFTIVELRWSETDFFDAIFANIL